MEGGVGFKMEGENMREKVDGIGEVRRHTIKMEEKRRQKGSD